jgi:hypothetical protein
MVEKGEKEKHIENEMSEKGEKGKIIENEVVEKGENGKKCLKKCMTWLRKLRKEKITE